VRLAIERHEFLPYFQPIVDLRSGRLAALEALLRWQHPERGIVLPECFIPQVEETTLINPVTQWVIGAVFADAGTWRSNGHRLRTSVNLSVHNLRDRMLLDLLKDSAARHGVEPAEIELEITESAVMSDPEYCIRLVAQLRDRGYRVSIDDFGKGHSSFGYLQKMRVSGLKIDQAFVTTLCENANNQKIVRSILHLADSMGHETVAEGVEDDGALALLREWGCDYAQGYRLHRPAPPSDLRRFLEARSATDAAASAR
jgi:EAL domain-containing protein (putative c-di-GMP-specific phosphodiesterase class I)